MTVRENERFLDVQRLSMGIDMDELLTLKMTAHGTEMSLAQRIRKTGGTFQNDEILDSFRVDKGHAAGPELHLVSKEGHIYILNLRKYIFQRPCVVTMLNARPNQVSRLYEAVGEQPDPEVMRACQRNIAHGWNR